MKKILGGILAISLLFGFIAGAQAIELPEESNQGMSANQRQKVRTRLDDTLQRLEQKGTGVDVDKLRRIFYEHLGFEEDEFCYNFEENLEYEDSGEDVEALQKILKIEGYLTGDYEEGLYGWSTARGLHDYQKDKEINPDSFKQKFGFQFGSKARDYFNDKYECSEEVSLEIMTMDEEEGTTSPKPDTYSYQPGEEVTVEAIPNESYQFILWEREGSATNCKQEEKECSFEIEKDSMLAAHFDEKDSKQCEKDEDCNWVSTNCCPENAGANWECTNKSQADLDCPDDPICPQVISPKPDASCSCTNGECEEGDVSGGSLQ